MDFNEFSALASEKIDAKLDDSQLNKLFLISNSLIENNKKFNLTALTDPSDIVSKHLADSIELGKYILGQDYQNKCLLDIGSGGGFPALPVSIFLPDLHVTAMDSTAKKMNYIEETAKNAKIDNISTIIGRAEEIGQNSIYRETFDIVTARAVSRLNVLLELSSPFVKVGGSIIAMKGAIANEELTEAKNAIKKLSLSFVKSVEYTLPGLDDKRYLLIFKKIAPISKEYPRMYSKITKHPL